MRKVNELLETFSSSCNSNDDDDDDDAVGEDASEKKGNNGYMFEATGQCIALGGPVPEQAELNWNFIHSDNT